MAQYYQPPPQPSPYNAPPANAAAPNLQFYQSSYPSQPVSGHSTPFQAQGYGVQQAGYGQPGYEGTSAGYGSAPAYGSFGGAGGVTGRMGEQGGLKTGWLAAFGTEGYEGEPPLLEELGVNFGHIKMKVSMAQSTRPRVVGKTCLPNAGMLTLTLTQTLTVLNPIGSIDQHIMDDADLAGPILFCLLFGFFLLFVSPLLLP